MLQRIRQHRFWILLAIIVFLASFLFNQPLAKVIPFLYSDWLNVFFLWITEPVFYIITFSLLFFLSLLGLKQKPWKNRQWILPLWISLLTSFVLSFLLKEIFQTSRPFADLNLPHLLTEDYPAFPSGHTALAFSLVIILYQINRTLGRIWLALACLIALSRLYTGVHYLSDVIGGGLIGLAVSYKVYLLQVVYKSFSRFLALLRTHLEIRRQFFHTATGIFLIILIKMGFLDIWGLGLLVLLGGILVIQAKRKQGQIPLLGRLLGWFERDDHIQHFPGRGSFFFGLGSFLSLLLFPENIALASIIILSLGDSITNIVGRHFGHLKVWFHPKKHWEGTLAGIVAGTFGASFFVPLLPAFLGSTLAMFAETFELKIERWEIDDNLVIPLVAGGMMLILS